MTGPSQCNSVGRVAVLLPGSSTIERLTLDQRVAGLNPARAFLIRENNVFAMEGDEGNLCLT